MKVRTLAWSASFLSLVVIALSAFPSPLWAQTIQVTSATPNNAEQGTINLNVVVGGGGYKKGAAAKWFVSGTTNPGGVVVNSTAFNSSSQLTANITVSSTADLSSYDIVVTNTDGRSGKGTQLFAVTQGNKPVTACGGPTGNGINVTSNILGTSNPPFQLLSDGLGTYMTYQLKRDSATSEIQANTCDWVLDLSNSKSRIVELSLEYPLSSGESLPSGWPTNGSLVKVPGLVRTNCGTGNPAFGTMTFAGQTIQCPMHIAFFSNGIQYMLRMNPSLYSGATWAQITCTGAASNQCNAWTITPIPSGDPGAVTNPYTQQNSGIGELAQPPCIGCDGGTPLGLYYWNFSITVTNP